MASKSTNMDSSMDNTTNNEHRAFKSHRLRTELQQDYKKQMSTNVSKQSNGSNDTLNDIMEIAQSSPRMIKAQAVTQESIQDFHEGLFEDEPSQPTAVSIQQRIKNLNPCTEKIKETEVRDHIQKLEDGYQKLEDDYQKLKDSNQKLDDGYQNLKDGYQNLKDDYQKMKDGYQKLEDGYHNLENDNKKLGHRMETLENIKSSTDIVTAPVIITGEIQDSLFDVDVQTAPITMIQEQTQGSSTTIEESPAITTSTMLNTQAIQFNPSTSKDDGHHKESKRTKLDDITNRTHRTRCKKCFKPFFSKKNGVYHTERHERNCTNVPCKCLKAPLYGKHEYPCTNKNWRGFGDEWKCQKSGCNKAYATKKMLLQHKRRKH